jgi:Fusaric acid resistance protein-like
VEKLATALRERVDVFLAFDPGFNQLLIAVGVMVGVAVTVGLVYVFVQASHALWIEPPAGVSLSPRDLTLLDAQHHGVTLLAMLVGGLVGMLSAFAVAETSPRQLAVTMALAPVPVLATMALAIGLEGHRTAGIAVMAVVMGIGTWLPKLGPWIGARAFFFGQLLFVGYLTGFLSQGAITDGKLGWMAAILWFSAVVNFVVKILVFAPLSRGTLRRTVRAFFARSRGVIVSAAEMFESASDRGRKRTRQRLDRRLIRANEAALIIDALLADRPEIAHEVHARLFETEVTVQNIGRMAQALSAAELPPELHRAIGACLTQLRDHGDQFGDDATASLLRLGEDRAIAIGPLQSGRVVRLARAIVDWRKALQRWHAAPIAASAPAAPFESPVTLIFGNLPGSTHASSAAAAPEGSMRARLRLDSRAQTGIRIAVAVAVASAFGSILSERRFYWAVIAVFIAFIGANTSGEQITKAINRVLGTIVGILLGSLLAHAIGHSTWSLAVIVLALGFGVYFIRVSYALMVIGVTVMVSELYQQLGEFSNHLLLLRLEETTIGAVVAALAALLVFPVHTRRAAGVAARDYYARLGELLKGLVEHLDSGRAESSLTTATRGLDHANQQLLTTARPLSRSPFRRDEVAHNLLLFGWAAHHARNVAAGVERGLVLPAPARTAAIEALNAQRELVTFLELHRARPTSSSEAGAAALIDQLRRTDDILPAVLGGAAHSDERFLMRHIARLGETLAELVDNLSSR